MAEALKRFSDLLKFSQENLVHAADIIIVALLLFWLLRLIRNTRAWRIVGGVATFVVLLFLSDFLQLRTLHWILEKATVLGPVALVILLLPELRLTLEGFAKIGLWPSKISGATAMTSIKTVDDLVSSATEMAASRVGAIIIIERVHSLDEIVENGVKLDADVSPALLVSLFSKGSPLHDGAAILRGNTLLAAACRLPLSENESLSKKYHMRHRAALGITELTDCVTIVVSEERGEISVAQEGDILTVKTPDDLRSMLMSALGVAEKIPRVGRKKKEAKDRVES